MSTKEIEKANQAHAEKLAKIEAEHGVNAASVIRSNHLKGLNNAAQKAVESDAKLLDDTETPSIGAIYARLVRLENPGKV